MCVIQKWSKMNNKIKKMRIPVELQQLQKSHKEHGITCSPQASNEDYSELVAIIPGPKGSAYEEGRFEIGISISPQYPFHPPTFKFLTPVYHPNIDNSGKICLDLLRMPPAGSYNPAITLESILLSIQLLLATPNPDDPLRGDASDLFRTNRQQFEALAREHVKRHCQIVEAKETEKEHGKENELVLE